MKFKNKKENDFDSLPETLAFIDKIQNFDDYQFSLGLATWKPNQGDKNYQLKFNKQEEIIMAFEGDILNKDYLNQFLLLSKGKIKKVLEAKNNPKISMDSVPDDQLSNEELLLNIYKYFLNQSLSDQKALQQLVGLVNGPLAISIFNKKDPNRVLCFWRDIQIHMHGEALMENLKTKENKSFIINKVFSGITLSTIKPNQWAETSNLAANCVHIITLQPNKEIQLEKGGLPIDVKSLVKSLTKTPTINAPKLSKIKKSNLRSEIFEQPSAIRRLLKIEENILNDLDTVKLDFMEGFEDYFSPDQRVVITGCGSSFFAGQSGARFLRQMRLFRDVKVVNSVEFDPFAFISSNTPITNIFGETSVTDYNSKILIPQENEKSPMSVPNKKRVPGNICIAVSQSGESSDVLNFLKKLKSEFPDCFIIGMTNSPGSSLTELANVSFFVNSGEELAVAATKSVTNTVVAFYMLGLWFEYLFKGPRLKEGNFKPKGILYQKMQSLEKRDLSISKHL
jgi:glucosamine 6-phosphate synthetase-like amidotransferase/phosphosugar isomerase protein